MPQKASNNIHSFYWQIVIRPHFAATGMVVLLVLGTAFFEMGVVGLGLPLLESALHAEATTNPIVLGIRSTLNYWGLPSTNNMVLFAILVLVSLTAILRGSLSLWTQYATAGIAKRLHCEIRSQLLQKLLLSSFGYLVSKSRGQILYNLNMPPASVFQVISYFSKLCQAALTTFFLIGLMFYLSWWATFAVALFGFLGIQGWRLFADKRSREAGQTIYDLESQVSKVEVDAIDGLKVVKSNSLTPQIVQRQESLLRAEIKPHLQIIFLSQGATFANEALAAMIVILLGGLSLGLQWGGLSFTKLVVFFLALRRISPALGAINSSYSQLNKERKNIEVVNEILYDLPEEKLGYKKIASVEKIRLEKISFHYPNKQEKCLALKGVNLTLKKGELTAIVGPTGSGKSTLANLLVGFYQPISGNIVVDNADLQALHLNTWRGKIGFVAQDIFLFNDTIRENIALWNTNISQTDVEMASRKAQLHEFILSLPEGYETIVGDRGIRLSGGQCQRVAIARAILMHPQILIFDEATSALDNITEKAVYEAIHSLRSQAIVLVIAHRLSTIKEADQIIVLDSGKIVECGAHDVLMKRNQVYARLYASIGKESGHEETYA